MTIYGLAFKVRQINLRLLFTISVELTRLPLVFLSHSDYRVQQSPFPSPPRARGTNILKIP